MFSPEVITGSNDFKSFLTHFELLADPKIRKISIGGKKTDKQPLYSGLRMYIFAIEFHRTLLEATRKSNDKNVIVF